jgi:hypothetical protein
MSIEARQALVNGGHLFFQDATQSSDLLDPNVTQTDLIALLQYLVEKGYHIEITAVKSDHSDDSGLGEHSHFNGWCVDCWPLASATAGDYMDAITDAFQAFLRDVAAAPHLYQIGLAGEAAAFTDNFTAAGPTAFHDDGADHVHIGAQ